MTIITQQMLKEPLEKWLQSGLLWLVMVAAWCGADRLFKKKAKVHHGAALLLPYDSLRAQGALAAAIAMEMGDGKSRRCDLAMFIQKIKEWKDYNASIGRLDTRPYYSYQEWCDEHFYWHNEASMSTMVRQLEALKLIRTGAYSKHDKRKRYDIDQVAINRLVAKWATANPEIAQKAGGLKIESTSRSIESSRLGRESKGFERESDRVDPESSRFERESHTSSNQFKKPNGFNQSAIKGSSSKREQAAAHAEPMASTEADSYSHTSKDESPDSGQGLLDAEILAQERTDETLSQVPLKVLPPEDTGLDTIISESSKNLKTPRDVWSTAHHQLSLLFDRSSFDMWLKKAVLCSYALIDGTGVYTVGVPTAHAQEMLQHRFYRNVHRVVEGLQNQPVSLKFEVYVPPPVARDEDYEDTALLRLLAQHKTDNRGYAK